MGRLGLARAVRLLAGAARGVAVDAAQTVRKPGVPGDEGGGRDSRGNPFVESFTYPGNLKRLFVALFGIAAGLTVIWYTAMFTVLSFLQTHDARRRDRRRR